jgi:hypothetical protein
MPPFPPDAMGYLIGHLVERETIYAVKVDGSHLDIDDMAGYRQAQELLSG